MTPKETNQQASGPETRSYEPPRSDAQASANTATSEDPNRFEKVAPAIEDFVFDMVRAGAKLYFGVKTPDAADPYRRGREEPTMHHRLERLKDAVAEARVEFRKGSHYPNGDRNRR
jgi:hypothetical protein